METALRIGVLCVLTALLALLLKKGTPELALALTLAAVTLVLLLLAEPLKELLTFLRELSAAAGVDESLMEPLYKTVGIAVVVRIGSSLCKDAGESALASAVETAGAVCSVLAALPLFRQVLQILLELMNG